MLELTPSEITATVRFAEGDRRYRVAHIFRPPAFDDWMEYEKNLRPSVEFVGESSRYDRHEAEACQVVWERIILRVAGYRVGGVDLMESSPQEWREKVDLWHKMAAINLLAQVAVAPPKTAEENGEAGEGDYSFDPERVEIRLVAGRDGRLHEDLVHVLRRPSARDKIEFSRKMSGALYVHGSRTQRSLIPSKLKAMVEFYDRLVSEVCGYGVNGAPATCEQAVKHMDAMHKKMAVSALFSPQEPPPPGEEAEAAAA